MGTVEQYFTQLKLLMKTILITKVFNSYLFQKDGLITEKYLFKKVEHFNYRIVKIKHACTKLNVPKMTKINPNPILKLEISFNYQLTINIKLNYVFSMNILVNFSFSLTIQNSIQSSLEDINKINKDNIYIPQNGISML